LGRGIACGLAEAGADIFGVGTMKKAPETQAAVEAAGRRFTWLSCDLISQAPIPRIIAGALEAYDRLDILVNNAGIIRRADSVDFSEKDWDDVLGLNLKSLFFLSQTAAKHYIGAGGGKIINIASMLSYQGGIRVPSYTASKGGVRTLTMLMACEWARFNINVNAIAPGYMATDNTAALRADHERSAAILDRIPAGRWGAPEDVAGAAVFLASDAASYMNGFTVAVDGGWLAR
jgi:2-deoxy-D-gluconate 3-dehydrogenase